jgi:SecD/SecF fusion protein
MMGAIRVGLLRAIDDHSLAEYLREIFTFTWLRNGHWPFMRVITVSNIDWIGKRYYFWVVSGIITIAGLAAFVMRGDDKYDIEFRGGTQVTFTLKPDPTTHKDLTQEEVRARIESLADKPGLKDLRGARVYGVGKPEEHRWEMQTTISNPPGQPEYVKNTLLTPLADSFGSLLEQTHALSFGRPGDEAKSVTQLQDQGVVIPIRYSSLQKNYEKTGITGIPAVDVNGYLNGTAVLINNISPDDPTGAKYPENADQLTERIRTERQALDAKAPYREFAIIPVTVKTPNGVEPATPGDKRPLARAVMVSVDPSVPYNDSTETIWQSKVAATEWSTLVKAMSHASNFQGVTSFDAVVAGQAKQQALVAILLSLILIVIYVWIRFGGIRYGIGAILSLIHDAVVAVAATVLSGIIYEKVFGGRPNSLLITDFKINLTMIAAYLTIIGYSVNDTIVIFDRVRELRGRSQAALSPKLINDAINQCFGRTIWTTFTVFIVVLIMYIWGGEGVRGFSFAMLIGVFTGAYSTLAIASPMLLATATAADRTGGPKRINPFLQRDQQMDSDPEAEQTVPDDQNNSENRP